MFWHLWKQVGVIAYPMYSASGAFLRVRRINMEIKKSMVRAMCGAKLMDKRNTLELMAC